jgi:hypothetical protein
MGLCCKYTTMADCIEFISLLNSEFIGLIMLLAIVEWT